MDVLITFFTSPVLWWIIILWSILWLYRKWDYVMGAIVLIVCKIYESKFFQRKKMIASIPPDLSSLNQEENGAMEADGMGDEFPGDDDEPAAAPDDFYHSELLGNPPFQPKHTRVIQIQVSNKTAQAQEFNLLGPNKNLHLDNCGNPEDVEITSTSENQSYEELLQQIKDGHFSSDLMRIQSTNTAQVISELMLSSHDIGGASIHVPLKTQAYFSANQFQSGIIDVPIHTVLDGNFNMEGKLMANTTVIFTFFDGEPTCDNSFEALIRQISTK